MSALLRSGWSSERSSPSPSESFVQQRCLLFCSATDTPSSLILAEVFAGLGIRAYVGKLSMDQNSLPNYIEPSSAAALSSAKSFIDSVKSLAASLPEGQQNLVHPVLTPRFVPTCSDDLLEGLGKLAVDEDVRVQSHMCEALDQVEWVRSSRGRDDEDVFQQVCPKRIVFKKACARAC